MDARKRKSSWEQGKSVSGFSRAARVCPDLRTALIDPDDAHKLRYAYERIQGCDEWREEADVSPTVRQVRSCHAA